jgi:hypothetical protein
MIVGRSVKIESDPLQLFQKRGIRKYVLAPGCAAGVVIWAGKGRFQIIEGRIAFANFVHQRHESGIVLSCRRQRNNIVVPD